MVETDLVDLLTAASVGVFGTNMFYGAKAVIPPGAGPFLSIIMTGGMPPSRIQSQIQPPAYQQPGAQVTVRGTSYAALKTMLFAAYGALNVRNTEINSRWYLSISPKQEPFDMDQDELGRLKFAFNVEIIAQGA
jgi:hypothetical protein